MKVENKDGRNWMNNDFRDLNKVNLKDDFSPPHIDILVNNVVKRCHLFF
jgi:hypothetical protein